LVGLVLVLLLTVFLGGAAAAAGIGLAAVGPRGRKWARMGFALWVTAVGRLAADVAENALLLLARWRCRLTGRLFSVSPALSGFVYRHFTPLALGALAIPPAVVAVFLIF